MMIVLNLPEIDSVVKFNHFMDDHSERLFYYESDCGLKWWDKDCWKTSNEVDDLIAKNMETLSYESDSSFFYWDEKILWGKYKDGTLDGWFEVEWFELPYQQNILDGINKKYNISLTIADFS